MKHKAKLTFTATRFLIIAVLLFSIINTVPAQTAVPAEDIAKKALAVTVYLQMTDNNGKPLGIGSGFFVAPNLIATNYHVIEGAAKGTAKIVDRYRKYDIQGITAADKENDLVLLQVTTVYGIKPIPLGDSDKVRIGETVYVTGNPKGLEGTFSDGIISSRRDKDTQERLQMTAPISPGSSGGPVLNRKGEVIGVSVAVHRALDAQNLNFAIPSKYLKKLIARPGTTKPLGKTNAAISPDTYFRRGNIRYELGDYVDAITDYTTVIRLKPDDASAYNNRGVAKVGLEQYFAAISDFDTAIRLNPDDADAYNNRGIAKGKLGQYFAAIADYDTAIRLNPDDANAYYNRGIAKADLGQHKAAIADYDTAIRLKLDDADAYYNRGVAKRKLGQHKAAIADYDTAIRLKLDDADAYYNRGVAKRKLGQHKAAIADYDTAIRLKPDHADAYYNRGFAKYDLEQYFAAITDYDTAIRLKPDYAKAYNNRGVTKRKLGQHKAAIADYDTVIRLKPDHADAYYNRGVAKYLLERKWEAGQDFRTALRLAKQAGDKNLIADCEKLIRLLNE